MEVNKVYYNINEELARLAHNMNSMRTFEEGKTTRDYKERVEHAYSLVEEVPEEYKEKGYILADRYAKRSAESINKYNRIRSMCPSVLISGAGNFPTRKKEKQNEAEGRYWQEHDKVENILEQIKNLEYYKPRNEHQGKARDSWDTTNDFFEVIQNEEANRLQLVFEGKPSEEFRTMLKKNGFKWSPKNGAWQRQLTNNAIYSTKLLIQKLNEMK